MMDIVERLRRHAVTGLDLEILETEAADEIDRLREALSNAHFAVYADAIGVVQKIKNDPITAMGGHHVVNFKTAKDWMWAIADDIERELTARSALKGDE
jgi:hypothetical protein